ncbi:DUF3887 domain-containing protein [Cyanobium sp. Morenito 9A2]|uniref:DUF3887 domain-containing protein n=1 Tax=Cyanobium sp. Morenito 9A2 TaxID=2823718 RepID=UPI0020CD32D1|nr:DUF3887 domain-containing protein [Cyanobium sp. Morenito 9A2]MCP9849376.1 DUF3887 domain-containing protein [Cyanobium sp. Morenito 9A2]
MIRPAALVRPVLTLALGLSLGGGALLAMAPPSGAQGGPTALGEAASRTRAEILLEALRQRNGEAVFASLAPDVRRFTSLPAIQARLNQVPPIRSVRILEVFSGADDSTIRAELLAGDQRRPLTLVIDAEGQLVAWRFDSTQLPIEQLARSFVAELAEGQVVTARSRLSIRLQEELTPAVIQARWRGLERRVGPFQQIKGTVVAHAGGDQQLVLVTTRFAKLTDNLFVIFDGQNRIVGIDFPIDTP